MKFLLALTVLASLVSCGKDNKIEAGSVTNGLGSSTALSSAVDQYGRVSLAAYIVDVNNNAFGAAKNTVEVYQFYNSSNSGCTLKQTGGFIKFSYWYCGSSSSSGTSSTVTVDHNSENLTAKKAELANIIGQAINYSNSADKRQLFVQTVTGTYTIDFRIPMSANPVVKSSSTSSVYFNYSFAGYSAY